MANSFSASDGEKVAEGRMRCPATTAHTPATRIYLPETPADIVEIRAYTAEIAADIAEIGTDMNAITGYRPESRIAFMDDAINWSKNATDTPESGNYRTEMAGNALETAASSRIVDVAFHVGP